MPYSGMVFLDDEIIAQSYTSENADKRLLVHAELKALIEADKKGYSFNERKRMQLFTNLEPCLMCLGAAMSSFIGEIYYALESPSDGAALFAKKWSPQSEDFSVDRTANKKCYEKMGYKDTGKREMISDKLMLAYYER